MLVFFTVKKAFVLLLQGLCVALSLFGAANVWAREMRELMPEERRLREEQVQAQQERRRMLRQELRRQERMPPPERADRSQRERSDAMPPRRLSPEERRQLREDLREAGKALYGRGRRPD